MKKYLSNSFLTTGTLVFTKIVEFLLMALLTRMITTYEYGEYTLFNSWVNIISIIIGGSLSSSFGIAKRDYRNNYPRYLSACIGLSYVYLFVTFMVGFAINKSWDVYYLCLIILHSFNMNILTSYNVMLIFDKKFLKASVLNIVKSILSFGLILLGITILQTTNQGIVAIVMLFISYFLISIYAQCEMILGTKCFYAASYWSYAVKNSFLMIFHNLSLVFLNQIDRIMIGDLLDNSYVALYSVIYSLSIVMSILWTGINRAWLPWLYDAFDKRAIQQIRNINNYLIMFMAFLTINYCYIAPELIKLFFNETYWDGIDMMPSILFGYFFSFIFSIYVNIEYCNKRIKWITLGTMISAGINTVSNWFSLPIFGYKVAAYTTLLAYFSLFFYHYMLNLKEKYIDNIILWTVICMMTVILGGCVYITDFTLFRYTIIILFDVFILLAIYHIMKNKNYGVVDDLKDIGMISIWKK